MAVDFRTLLSKPMDEVKRPPALPAGTYHGIIKSREFGESKEKHTPYVRFTIQPTGPGDGLDPSELVEIDLTKKQLFRDYFLTDQADYRLKELAESLGITTSGHSTGEIVEEMLNQQILFEVTQRLNPKDPTAPPYNDVGNIKGLE